MLSQVSTVIRNAVSRSVLSEEFLDTVERKTSQLGLDRVSTKELEIYVKQLGWLITIIIIANFDAHFDTNSSFSESLQSR